MPTFLDCVQAPSHWHSVDFVSDLHLQQDDAVWQAFVHYLQHTPADAIFLLGDIFELWVGDDILESTHGLFEQQVASTLEAVSQSKALYILHGNRDFMLGDAFCQQAGTQLLHDPCVLQWHDGTTRVLLSHGDALCIDDHEYQQLRQQLRQPAWQHAMLQRPLAERLALGQHMRAQSASRKNELGVEGYADVDTALALQWLEQHCCNVLVHGHTHKPNRHVLQSTPHKERIVLPDWDSHSSPQRAGILRLNPALSQPWQSIPVNL